MDVLTPMLTEFAKRIPDAVVRFLKSKEAHSGYTFEDSLRSHLAWVSAWSNEIQFYGMSYPQETDTATIALRLMNVPRKFQGQETGVKELNEGEILEGSTPYMILGDPGAGKTTTLKRIARKVLTSEAASEGDKWQYPIVIRFRDLKTGLIEGLANILGIKYAYKKVLHSVPTPKRNMIQTLHEPYCGDTPLHKVVIDLLDATQPILLLDGLDEVPVQRITPLERELSMLALRRNDYKMLVSCRSGEYTRIIEGLCLIEMCPLSHEEIELIGQLWLGDASEFLSRLEVSPFGDLANRPLFLTQLTLFFKRCGYLPERPADVYSKIISLMLEDWDTQRGIYRKSKYAGFTPIRKAEFLSALAYRMTYGIKTKVFDTRTLVTIYRELCVGFGLPENEARDVAREIETHTGIVIQGRADTFEFSHLSLQEYLCAFYLSRAPLAEHMADYLAVYPAPLAVMVAISAEPSNALAALLLSPESYREIDLNKLGVMQRFVSRLAQEKPYFTRSKYLGLAILRLVSLEDQFITKWIDELVRSDVHVRRSLSDAIAYYRLIRQRDLLMVHPVYRTSVCEHRSQAF